MEAAGIEELALFGVIGIVVIVAVAAFARRLGIAAPLILLLVGIGISYAPGAPDIAVDPNWILLAVLPPILYSSAVQLPIRDFRRDLGPISALSVVLVVGSALATGFALFVILPDLNLGAAIAVGAVISPTDVVAATSIGRRLGLPPRVLNILEGEGLVNDATALVLLRTAVAAAAASAGGTLSIGGAVLDFLYALLLAIVIGAVVGVVTVLVRSRLSDPVLDTAISLAVPFVAFIPAEDLHASGVISVVVAGLYTGYMAPRRFSAQFRISERLNWRTVQFVLENGVFLLMGAQLKHIVDEVHTEGLDSGQAVLLGLLCAGILIGVRYLAVGPLIVLLRKQQHRIPAAEARLSSLAERITAFVDRSAAHGEDERRDRRVARWRRAAARRGNDLRQLGQEGLDWRGGVVIGWAGMRGVVTLAAAQSLPDSTDYYPMLVLIAFTVAIATLLLHGTTLPVLIRRIGIRGSDRVADRRELADLLDEMSAAGLALLDRDGEAVTLDGGETVADEVVERVRHDTQVSASVARERAETGDTGEDPGDTPHRQYRVLRRSVLDAEREALLEASSRNAYPSRILRRAQTLLDLEETRLEQLGTGGREQH